VSLKFLIAGLGSIGRRHLRNLKALGETDIVFYRTHQSTLPEDELKGFPVETDIHAALRHQPHAVIVCNPTALHMDVAIPAAQAGCHLLLEKPISNSLDRIDVLRAAVLKGGGEVLVGFQFRFHPTLQIAARLIREGAIGRPLYVRAHWGEYLPGWHPSENYKMGYAARKDLGGGALLTLCHPIDYLRYLFGEIQSLTAVIDSIGDLAISTEDVVEINLRFANGAMGSLHLDYLQQPPAHRVEIIGTEGSLLWDNEDGCLRLYRAPLKKWKTWFPPEGFERNTLFLEEMRHFISVVQRKISPVCGLEDGVKVIEVTHAAKQAAEKGRKVVVAYE